MDKKNKINFNKIKNLLFSYIVEIYYYEEYLDNIYNSINQEEYHRGYIINLNDFDKLKKELNYKYLKNFLFYNINKYLKEEVHKLIINKNIIKIPKIKQMKYTRPSELINLIKNYNNEFIVINTELYEVICKRENTNNEFIKYIIDNKNSTLKILNDFGNIIFKFNNNILNYYFFIKVENNINKELYNIIQAIVEYYYFENKIKKDLNTNQYKYRVFN